MSAASKVCLLVYCISGHPLHLIVIEIGLSLLGGETLAGLLQVDPHIELAAVFL